MEFTENTITHLEGRLRSHITDEEREQLKEKLEYNKKKLIDLRRKEERMGKDLQQHLQMEVTALEKRVQNLEQGIVKLIAEMTSSKLDKAVNLLEQEKERVKQLEHLNHVHAIYCAQCH